MANAPGTTPTNDLSAGKGAAGTEANRVQIPLDDSKSVTGYANFCRLVSAPEEVILDFGLNPNPAGVFQEAIRLQHRVILNYATAKRILGLLHQAVGRFEEANGAIELDPAKRAAKKK